MINFRITSSNRKNSGLEMGDAQMDVLFTSEPRHKQLVSFFVFNCVFILARPRPDLNLGLESDALRSMLA